MYTVSMKPDTEAGQELLYVLKRPDGSVRAELPMTPSMAAKINAARKKRGFFDGDWEPQPVSQYGLWHLNFTGMPDWMLDALKKAQQEGQSATHRKTNQVGS